MSSDVVVRPVRFTDDVSAMARFLEVLGLRRRVESDGGGWVDLVAGQGMVAVHDAASSATRQPSGRTTLSFECADADALVERLRAAGWEDAGVYDEAYGRVVTVTGPLGTVQVDEWNDDLHGYRLADVTGADPGTAVRPALTCPDPAAVEPFLATLGAAYGVDVVAGEPSDPGTALRPDGVVAPVAVVELALVATEPLAGLAERLREGGYDVAHLDGAARLSVVDPDGQVVTVRAAGA